MDEIFRIISETEAGNEAELVEALKAAEKDEKTIEAALAISRVFSAYSEDITKTDFDAIAKSLGYADEPVVEDTEEITKSDLEALPENVRTKIEKMQEDAQATEDRLAEIENTLSEKSEAEELAQMKEKVSDLENVAKSADELAEIVLKVKKSSGDEAADALIEALKSANSAKPEDFVEKGSTGEGDVEDDVYTEMQREADVIVKAEGVSVHKAMEMLKERNPKLVKRYADSQRS